MADAKIITYGELISATTDVIPDGVDPALLIEDTAGLDFLEIDTENEQMILAGGGAKVGVAVAAPLHQLHVQDGDLGIVTNSADDLAKSLIFTKSKNATDGDLSTVVDDDTVLGNIIFKGADSTGVLEPGAQIRAQILAGTVGDGRMPSELIFSTAPDSASGVVDHMKISDAVISMNLGTAKSFEIATVDRNVLVGMNGAGEELTPGDGGSTQGRGNIILGDQAAADSTTPINGVFIGCLAAADGTNTGTANVAIGYASLYSLVSGTGNTGIGQNAGGSVTDGSRNTCVGDSANVSAGNAVNQTGIGYQAAAHGDHRVTIGNANVVNIEPHSDESCDLGHASYAFNDVHAVALAEASDERLKEQIEDTSLGLDFISRLRPVSYKFRDTEAEFETRTDVLGVSEEVLVQPALSHSRKHQGLVAQEVKQVLDDIGMDAADFGGYVDANISGGADKLALRYRQFIAPLIKAVQELTARIEELENG